MAIKRDYLIYLLLILITVAIYSRVTRFDFINYDDSQYVVNNPHITQGLNLDSVVWAFTNEYESNWIPGTWISFMIDHQLGGAVPYYKQGVKIENPAPYHRTNLILHVLNALLLFALLSAATGRRWRSAMVAALFAVHPLHVESVAWVAERKDVLSTFFMLLTLCAYVWYARRRGVARYLVVVVAFGLGLMAKPMLVTLPVLMLLLDFWPLKRIAGKADDDSKPGRTVLQLVLEKVPLLALSLMVSAVTVLLQQHSGAVTSFNEFPPALRVENALVCYMIYLWKTVWPVNLAFFYPRPESFPMWQLALSSLLIVALSREALSGSRQRPYVTVGWLWYLISMLPVIGLLHVGNTAMADRYAYITLIGVFVAVVWLVADLVEKRPVACRRALGGASIAAVLVLSVLAYRQVGYWRNDLMLFGHAVSVNSDNDFAHITYAGALMEDGQYQAAEKHYRFLVERRPTDDRLHYRLAKSLDKQNKARDAVAEYRATLRYNPDKWRATSRLAWYLATARDSTVRDPEEAVEQAEEADLVTNHQDPGVVQTLAAAYAAAGRYDEAVVAARLAAQLATSSHQTALARDILREMAVYQAHRPYIDTRPTR